MPISFPANPAINQQHETGGRTWTWDGVRWMPEGVGVIVANVKPTISTAGRLWLDSEDATLRARIGGDWVALRGRGGQVAAEGATGPMGPMGPSGSIGATGATGAGVARSSGADFGISGISYANSSNAAAGSTVTITGNGFVAGANVFVGPQFTVDGGTYLMTNINVVSNSAITFTTPSLPSFNIIYNGSRYGVSLINGDGQLAYRPNLLLTKVEYTGPPQVEYLVIAGGGGGGQGGGGAGGMVVGNANIQMSPGLSHTITVGGGGARYTGLGSNSVLGVVGLTVTGIGGGGGGNANSNGTNGGSGGGSGGNSGGSQSGGAGTQTSPPGGVGYGFNGSGNPSTSSPWPSGAGGGGGGAASGNTNGPGRANNITGTSITYAIGGAGSTYYAADAANADANTGDGGDGGGANNGGDGGIGGSGIVIIAYANVFANITTIDAGLTYTYSADTRPGFKVYKFIQGTGTISW